MSLKEFPYFMTRQDLEKILPYSRGRLQRMFSEKVLPGRKLSGRWVISKPQLLKWLKENLRG